MSRVEKFKDKVLTGKLLFFLPASARRAGRDWEVWEVWDLVIFLVGVVLESGTSCLALLLLSSGSELKDSTTIGFAQQDILVSAFGPATISDSLNISEMFLAFPRVWLGPAPCLVTLAITSYRTRASATSSSLCPRIASGWLPWAVELRKQS